MLPSNTLASLFFRRLQEAEARVDRVYEPVIGIVVDNKDPDKLARVKVRFPVLGGEDTSGWAPIAALGAGKERGWFFLPEVDDEVVVLFAHGEISRPVVIGAVWNGKDAPPDTNGGSNERRCIVSREGSKIIFDDDAGTLTLEDGGGAGKIVISKENKITIESSSGDVCFQAPAGDLNIVAKELTMEGSMNCHLEAKMGLKLGSDGDVTIKSGGMLKIHGATTDLKPQGGAQAPGGGEASCEEVPDPVGG